VIETIVSMEHLLAAWRDAERALDELEPDDPRQGEAEARVAEGRAAYRARIEAIGDTLPRGILISAR
jgi:hypothetical protein